MDQLPTGRGRQRLLFATHNEWKRKLFHPIFYRYGFEMVTLKDLNRELLSPPENGKTALENAVMKARFYHSNEFPWVFGDDAGLEIDALQGEPGVQARRWGGIFTENVDDQAWLDYLLLRLKHVPPGKRSAAFVAGWALIDPKGEVFTRQVRADFEIATQPIRPISPGSPITAVRLGPPEDLSRRQEEIAVEWQRWGILEEVING